MTCNNCNCNCKSSDNTEEYQEFVPNREYAIGEFFKVGDEVFKVHLGENSGLRCEYCDFNGDKFGCNTRCGGYERNSWDSIFVTLYDTLDEDE